MDNYQKSKAKRTKRQSRKHFPSIEEVKLPASWGKVDGRGLRFDYPPENLKKTARWLPTSVGISGVDDERPWEFLTGKGPNVEVVGSKTHEELENDWLAHYKANAPISGRPDGEGWLTVREMALASNTNQQKINKYLRENEANYEKKKGTINARATTYYRFKGNAPVGTERSL